MSGELSVRRPWPTQPGPPSVRSEGGTWSSGWAQDPRMESSTSLCLLPPG